MNRSNILRCVFLLIVLFVPSKVIFAQVRLLDDFETLQGWRELPSEGAKLAITGGEGKSGKAMVMEFDLSGASGYVIAQKDFTIDVPLDYQFTFDLRAEAPVNNFEFKLLDSLENVYWIKKLSADYPKTWTRMKIKRRQISFAWGPSVGAELRRVRKVEFVVSVGTGGKGKVWIDNFKFQPIVQEKQTKAQVVTTSSSLGVKPKLTRDSILAPWRSSSKEEEWLTVNFNRQREVGGLIIGWDKDDYATKYDVLLSDDGKEWWTAYSVTNGSGKRDFIALPEAEGRWLKLQMKKSSRNRGYSMKKVELKGAGFSSSPNNFFHSVAAESPKGFYPKYFYDQQAYWTIVGVNGDAKEALVNEYGQIEVDRASFSLEPFLYFDGKLVTWNDVTTTQALIDDYVPVPSVTWNYHNLLKLTIQAVAAGVPGRTQVGVRYTVEATAPNVTGKLFIALRPFQVNPPWQSLNIKGGVSRIDSVRYLNGTVYADSRVVIPMSWPSAFGATELDQGDITYFLSNGSVPPTQTITDHTGYASAALQYDFNLQSGERREAFLSVPLESAERGPKPNMSSGNAMMYYELMLGTTVAGWRSRLEKLQITLPPMAQSILNVVKSNLAYILINRDGPAIQPGSRTYERSWMRDGSLTATALLQTGNYREAREFIDWYAKYQYPSGKIPCVVDTRGADPTNEHDSHGEFIYAVMQCFHFTKDTSWLKGKWDQIVKTVRFIQSLRAERKTEIYRTGTAEQRACYGLVPESISHEGYSSKPMHSYWDDFFTMRGLKDAADAARVLGEKKLEEEFSSERDDFKKDLYTSIRLSMHNKRVDYIPGCVELGDFDATSTTIGIDPGNELGNIPEPQLHNTFDQYYSYFVNRQKNVTNWRDYTPYETRIIGTFVRLDQKERAHEAILFFMRDMRPVGWNHWAEVVHRDPLMPKFIGDMPHTWVGSDFLRSIRSMFVYERERDTALVVGAGIPEAWLVESGVSVKELPTYYGGLNFGMKDDGGNVVAELSGSIDIPKGGIIFKSPREKPLKSVRVNGNEYKQFTTSEVILRGLPAKIDLLY